MVHCWISFKIESNIPVIYSRWRPLIKYRNFFDCLLLLYYKSKWLQLLTSATWQLRSVWYFPGFLWFCFSANLYRLNMIFYKHIFKLDKLLKKKNIKGKGSFILKTPSYLGLYCIAGYNSIEITVNIRITERGGSRGQAELKKSISRSLWAQ